MFIRQNYRIYPNKDQQAILNQWLGCARFVWNHMLELNIKSYQETGKFIFAYEMHKMLPQMKKQEETSWLKNAPSQGLQQKCQDLDTALKAFFKTTENRRGFPKFKSRKTDQSGIRMADYKLKDGKLFLPKIKSAIKIKIDRNFLGRPGMITVKKDRTGCWYVSFTVDVGSRYDYRMPIADIETAVGIDVGIKSFAVTTDGEVIENPRFLKRQMKKLKRRHKELSRKQKGSSNREKARIRLARLYKRISNQRKDYIKQNASAIAKLYDFISVEDLNVSGMVKNHCLAQAVMDVSFGMFINELEWQCRKRGKHFHKIDRWFASSKTCCHCGHVKGDLSLSDRTYECPACESKMDRDLNAAINILNKGLSDCNIKIPQELGKYTPARNEAAMVASEQETSVL